MQRSQTDAFLCYLPLKARFRLAAKNSQQRRAAMLKPLLLILGLHAGFVSSIWVKAAGPTCVGINDPCSDMTTCTATHLGPCESDAPGPSEYITMNVEGLAMVADAAQYLTSSAYYQTIGGTGPGYRDFSAKVDINGGSFSFTASGNLFGQTWGGYISTSNYVSSAHARPHWAPTHPTPLTSRWRHAVQQWANQHQNQQRRSVHCRHKQHRAGHSRRVNHRRANWPVQRLFYGSSGGKLQQIRRLRPRCVFEHHHWLHV